MTKAQILTLSIILVATAGLIAWDIGLALDSTEGNTISAVITSLSLKTSAVPFALGALMGHFFWPIDKDRKPWQVIAPLTALLAGMVALDFTLGAHWLILPGKFITGFIAGHFLWPNRQSA